MWDDIFYYSEWVVQNDFIISSEMFCLLKHIPKVKLHTHTHTQIDITELQLEQAGLLTLCL